MYKIRFSEGVETDLKKIKMYDRRQIIEEIEVHLVSKPLEVTRKKKILKNRLNKHFISGVGLFCIWLKIIPFAISFDSFCLCWCSSIGRASDL